MKRSRLLRILLSFLVLFTLGSARMPLPCQGDGHGHACAATACTCDETCSCNFGCQANAEETTLSAAACPACLAEKQTAGIGHFSPPKQQPPTALPWQPWILALDVTQRFLRPRPGRLADLRLPPPVPPPNGES